MTTGLRRSRAGLPCRPLTLSAGGFWETVAPPWVLWCHVDQARRHSGGKREECIAPAFIFEIIFPPDELSGGL